jgi:hypothetical protein
MVTGGNVSASRTTPVLFRFPLHGWRIWILSLYPMRRAAGTLERRFMKKRKIVMIIILREPEITRVHRIFFPACATVIAAASSIPA